MLTSFKCTQHFVGSRTDSQIASTSVLIAARNAESTVGPAIQSALRGLERDDEVLLIDDASTDATFAAARAIHDRRLHVFRGDESLGSGQRRTELLERASGRWVAILDADDLSLPWRFRLSRRAIGEASVLFAAALRFTNGQFKARPASWRRMCSNDIPAALLIHNPIVHSTVFADRLVLASLGGYRAIQRGQDYDLWLRAAASRVPLRHLNIPLAGYRQSARQISRSFDYDATVNRDPQIGASYRALASKVFPNILLSTGTDITSLRRSLAPTLATSAAWPGRLSPYYRRLVNELLLTPDDPH